MVKADFYDMGILFDIESWSSYICWKSRKDNIWGRGMLVTCHKERDRQI